MDGAGENFEEVGLFSVCLTRGDTVLWTEVSWRALLAAYSLPMFDVGTTKVVSVLDVCTGVVRRMRHRDSDEMVFIDPS